MFKVIVDQKTYIYSKKSKEPYQCESWK